MSLHRLASVGRPVRPICPAVGPNTEAGRAPVRFMIALHFAQVDVGRKQPSHTLTLHMLQFLKMYPGATGTLHPGHFLGAFRLSLMLSGSRLKDPAALPSAYRPVKGLFAPPSAGRPANGVLAKPSAG